MITVGDIHGEIHSLLQRLDKFNIKRTNIYQVGDWGLGFHEKEKDLHNLDIVNEIMKELGCHIYIIRGNHDDPKFWNDGCSMSNLTLVKDYDVIDNEDGRTLCIGGGISIDRCQRVLGRSYWEDEIVIFDEDKLMTALDQKINRVITHVAPMIAWPTDKLKNGMVGNFINAEKYYSEWKERDLEADLIRERNILTDVHTIIKTHQGVVDNWLYGHYHKNMSSTYMDTQFTCCGILECWDGEKFL